MSEQAPEFHPDVFSIGSGSGGVTLTFGASPGPDETEGHDYCVVRLSHQDAKSLAMMLRGQVKRYEKETKTEVVVPVDVKDRFGLGKDDW